MPILKQRNGRNMAGQAIGILLLETYAIHLPGNVANATSFNFPVMYKAVPAVTSDRLVKHADESILEPLIAAGKELVREGVRAISSGCGYFSYFQKEMADALDVPVFMSSLLQVPLIARSLRSSQKVGIIFADAKSVREKTLRAAGIDESVPIVTLGLDDQHEFFSTFLGNKGWMDTDRVEQEVVGAVKQFVAAHPELGAIVLECSDIPVYAAAIQREVGLPVFDFITLINWIFNAVVREPFNGYI
jgi:Asp/Glu/hydantoin racemase